MISCTRTQPIPITTSSEKAMTHYMSALDAIDGYEVNKARTFFRKAIAADSNFAMAHLSLGTSIMDETERLKYFKKAKELKKYSSNGEQKLIDAYYTLMVDQDTNGFLQQMEKIVAEYPNDARIRAQFGYSIRNLDPDRGLAEVRKAVKTDPEFSFGHNLLGYLYLEQEDFVNAEKAFQEYLRLEPDVANPYDSMADMRVRTGNYEEAINYYRKAVLIDSSFFLSQQKIGLSYIFMGDFEKGRVELAKAVDLGSNSAVKLGLKYCFARSYCYEGRYQDALKALDDLDSLVTSFDGSTVPAQHMMAKSLICIFADMHDQAQVFLDESLQLMKQMENDGIITTGLVDEVDFISAYRGLKVHDLVAVNRIKKSFIDDHDQLANLARLEENQKTSSTNQSTTPVQIAVFPSVNFSSARSERDLLNARLEASKARLNTLSGLMAYYRNDYSEAKKRLLLVPESELLRTYYLALTLDKLHEYREAHKLLDGILHLGKDSALYSVIYYKALEKQREIQSLEMNL
ncbi:tetratricopeptide repeat protein [bacterium]|nr:tetratricopeptide repeat protein [bacterium]